MKNSGKSPYEIRLELLQLSNSILFARYSADTSDGKQPPTSEEVMLEAVKLNEFVSASHTDR